MRQTREVWSRVVILLELEIQLLNKSYSSNAINKTNQGSRSTLHEPMPNKDEENENTWIHKLFISVH